MKTMNDYLAQTETVKYYNVPPDSKVQLVITEIHKKDGNVEWNIRVREKGKEFNLNWIYRDYGYMRYGPDEAYVSAELKWQSLCEDRKIELDPVINALHSNLEAAKNKRNELRTALGNAECAVEHYEKRIKECNDEA